MVERFNLYEVRINGKLQGHIRAVFGDSNAPQHFMVDGDNGHYDNQAEAVLRCIRRNGRKVPSDIKVKYKKGK